MDVRLSVVIPTLGRPSLERAVESCADADEIVVVLDKAQGGSVAWCDLPPNVVYAEGNFGVTGGHAGRQYGIERATGTHLAFFDDDDAYLPGAVELMREAACDRPVIFRMDDYQHGVIWRTPDLYFGNVSTQMYVVPNQPGKLGSWEPHAPGLPQPGGDFTFIKGCVEKMGPPVWREEVIAVLRPTPERMARYSTITIVTPWYKHPELAPDYVEAVEPELRPGDEVLIVDNGGTPAWVPFRRLTTGGRNLGFAQGSNLGLEAAETDAVLFLNNDIVLGKRGWLDQLRFALQPGYLVGPMRFDPHADVDGQKMPYIDGWCLAGMRDELLELGGFDPELSEPAYYSDNLLCLAARAAGLTLREVQVQLQHKASVTSGPGHDPQVRQVSAVNRQRYIDRVRSLVATP